MARDVGRRAGLAVEAERTIQYWRQQASEEASGLAEATVKVSVLQQDLLFERRKLTKARRARDRLQHLFHASELKVGEAERALVHEQEDKAKVVEERDGLKARLSTATTHIAALTNSNKQLSEELGVERTAAQELRARLDEELSGREERQAMVLQLSSQLLDTQRKLTQCSGSQASCSQALGTCQQRRKEAERQADQLYADQRYACVGWVEALASRVKARLRDLGSSRARSLPASSASYYYISYEQ